jgi:hypothetical protein
MAAPAHGLDAMAGNVSAKEAPIVTGDFVEVSLSGRIFKVSARVIRVPGTGRVVRVGCDVAGLPDGQRATIEECTVMSSAMRGYRRNEATNMAGPAAATGGTGQLPNAELTVCVTATVDFGPLNPETRRASRCSAEAGNIEIVVRDPRHAH